MEKIDLIQISARLKILIPLLDERGRRLLYATEAKLLGHGGIQIISDLSGASRTTISTGLKEIKTTDLIDKNRIRKIGGGRKKTVDKMPKIEETLAKLIEPAVRGEPDSPLLWTSKSLRNLSTELKENGFIVSHTSVGEILKKNGFSLQANRKTDEGKSHPDRNAQFEHIHAKIKEYQSENQPIISVDAKKKELVGNFKNAGKKFCRKKEPEKVKVYDFPGEADGKAIPYGVYDITLNKGWVNVGIDHDTAEFAVDTIRKWWLNMGFLFYQKAKKLMITADGGGSNSSRSRLWKIELQKLSNEIGMDIEVSHFPPATSKWNKIEHRLFSYIAQNWRGKPLLSYEIIVSLIGSTKTSKGLDVFCDLDPKKYDIGKKITDKELNQINLIRNEFHGEWNYKISPNNIL